MKQRREADLKAEHRIVLQALEVVNLAHLRLACVYEVVDALLPEQTKLLQETYTKSLSLTVSAILKQLCVRHYVFSTGLIGSRRYYGSVNVLNPSKTPLPNKQSPRSLVLELVRDTVTNLGRAVRSRDIVEYATKHKRFNSIEPELIVRNVLSLAATGELITKAVRGDGGGINLYLPYDFDLKLFVQHHPPTWLEEIAKYVNEFWAERVAQASVEGTKPRPFSTGEFRSFVATKEFRFEPEPKGDPQNLVNVLKSLSITRNPLLRRIKRSGEKACLWVPFQIRNADLFRGNVCVNDAERIGMAVQRATKRLGRPVKFQDIREELELDASLNLTGNQKLFMIISDAAKEQTYMNLRGERKSSLRRVYRIGRLGNETYYDTSYKPDSCNWLRFQQLKARWEVVCAKERLSNLANGSVPSIIIGRAMLIISDVEEIAQELSKLVAEEDLYETVRDEAKMLCGNISHVLKQAHIWLEANNFNTTNLPTEVNTEVVGWTASELLEFMKMISPRAKRLMNHNRLIGLMKDNIRRIPNKNFVYRFSNDPQTRCDYLYDRTNAFIYAAKQWGGIECCTQAMVADVELERLRDVRFILPALESQNHNTRFAGVACLAFLRTEEGNESLHRIAKTDADPGIRRSALWAYCFAGGDCSDEVLRDRARTDPNADVRQFATQAHGSDTLRWWTC